MSMAMDEGMDFPVGEAPLEVAPAEEAQEQAPAQEQPQPVDGDSSHQNLEASVPPQQEQPTPGPSTEDELRRQLNEAMGVISQLRQGQLEQPAQTQPAQQQTPEPFQNLQPGQVAQLDFLQGQDHVAILEDPQKFNELLSRVATTAFTAAVQAAQEQVMLRIPSIVSSTASQQQEIARIADDFYKANSDLANFKPAVSMAATQLYQENPNLTLPELLAQAATRTREVLHLKSAAAAAGRQRVPAQPAGNSVQGGGSRTASDPQLSDMQKQIADLLDLQ